MCVIRVHFIVVLQILSLHLLENASLHAWVVDDASPEQTVSHQTRLKNFWATQPMHSRIENRAAPFLADVAVERRVCGGGERVAAAHRREVGAREQA